METNNPNASESIIGLVNQDKNVDFRETLSQEQKSDIIQGTKEIENGEVVDYEEFMKKYRVSEK